MSQEYDVIALGSGSAGYAVASKCREAGCRVALVEARELGGTCPLRGCNPKKVLVGAAEIVARGKDLQGKGLQSASNINWRELIEFKRTLTEPMPKIIARNFEEDQIDIYKGPAHFLGNNRIEVEGQELSGRHIFIGTGSTPRTLDMPGAEHVITSEDFLELEHLPESVIFIGGGYVSFEFAHVAARAGARPVIGKDFARSHRRPG
jgi:glutathione reductase (NADPH)